MKANDYYDNVYAADTLVTDKYSVPSDYDDQIVVNNNNMGGSGYDYYDDSYSNRINMFYGNYFNPYWQDPYYFNFGFNYGYPYMGFGMNFGYGFGIGFGYGYGSILIMAMAILIMAMVILIMIHMAMADITAAITRITEMVITIQMPIIHHTEEEKDPAICHQTIMII